MAYSTRRAQLVSPFGVGALIDAGQESFACVDITRWGNGTCDQILDSQLERKLRRSVMTPRAVQGAPGVPVVRFPRWLFCPKCRALQFYTPAHDEANGFKTPKCGKCRQELTPMGFVAVCPDGHMQDVDWFRWAHQFSQVAQHGQCSRQTAKLSFQASGKNGGDWDALEVRCSCGAARDLRGLVGPELPTRLLPCKGNQPWQKLDGACAKPVRVFRRGAGNIYHPKPVSALDLLPSGDMPVLDEMITVVRQAPWFTIAQGLAQAFKGVGGLKWPDHEVHIRPNAQVLSQEYGWPFDSVVEAILQACNGSPAEEAPDIIVMDTVQEAILAEEWPTLARRAPAQTKLIDVQPVTIPTSWPVGLRNTFMGVSLVRRLREVRALVGFRRVSPDAEARLVPVDLGFGLNWYPGVEVHGEGVFVWLREEAVAAWETAVRPSISSRMETLKSVCLKRGWNAASMATPRFVMLHTLAHVLMRRLAFDAGYSSASLRERIYAAGGACPMAGILIYTADSDSEGSLGGLVRMGEPERLQRTLLNALRDAGWCSADPVCRETEAQGVAGTNAAACHACALVSETSCVHNNALLDRRTLVRGDGLPLGFFDLASLDA